jgi:hypothetical protein
MAASANSAKDSVRIRSPLLSKDDADDDGGGDDADVLEVESSATFANVLSHLVAVKLVTRLLPLPLRTVDAADRRVIDACCCSCGRKVATNFMASRAASEAARATELLLSASDLSDAGTC